MTAIEMLDELRKSWHVEIYSRNEGDGHDGAVVELFELLKIGRPNVTDMVARYVETKLERAIERAWVGEPADG